MNCFSFSLRIDRQADLCFYMFGDPKGRRGFLYLSIYCVRREDWEDERNWAGIWDITHGWEDICNTSHFSLKINMDRFLKLFGTL